MRHLKTPLAVLGAATILVLAGNTISMAATGKSFILGKANTASTITKLTKTTAGPVINLTTKKASNPPFSTNGKGKVTNLNADTIDGIDSAALKSPVYVLSKAITVGTTSVSIPITLPRGNYIVSYSAFLSGAENTQVGCYMYRSDPTLFFGESRFTAGAATPGLTGSGYAPMTAAGNTLSLICSGGAAFTTFAAEPIQIVATRVDQASYSITRIAPGARHSN